MTDGPIRASDQERESVVDVLRDAYADGRLTLDEFLGAVTLLKDTQASGARVASPEERGQRAEQEDAQHLWQIGLALMIMTLVVEGVIASRTA